MYEIIQMSLKLTLGSSKEHKLNHNVFSFWCYAKRKIYLGSVSLFVLYQVTFHL